MILCENYLLCLRCRCFGLEQENTRTHTTGAFPRPCAYAQVDIHAAYLFLTLASCDDCFVLLPADRIMSATEAISSILPKDYGYVFAGLFAVGVANTYLVVNVVRARTKFDIKPPILYATKEVRYGEAWHIRHAFFRTRVEVFMAGRGVFKSMMRVSSSYVDISHS